MWRRAAWILVVISALSLFGLTQEVSPTESAGQTQPLSLDQAVSIALKIHPALKQAEAAVSAAEARVKEVRAAYFPQLSFSGIGKVGLSGTTGALGLPGFPASPFWRNTAYSANWYQNIFDFGRVRHSVAAQKALAGSARFQQIAEEDRIVLGVKHAYFTVLEAQQLKRVAEAIVQDRKLTLDRVRAYYQAEMGSKLDVDLAQANLAEAQGDLIRARNATATAFAAVRAAMGVDGAQDYTLEAPRLEPHSLPILEDLVQQGLMKRPDAQSVRLKIDALQENIGFARAKTLPSINGFGAGGQGRFNGTTIKEEQRHGVGALGLLFPIFTGGRLKAEREEARAELEGALAARDELNQQIRLEVTQAFYQLVDSSERIGAAEEQQRAAEEALKLAQARSQAQLASFLDVVTAEVVAARAETNYSRTRYDYQRAEARLEFATGRSVRP